MKVSVPLPRPEAHALLCPRPRRACAGGKAPLALGGDCPLLKPLSATRRLLPDNFFGEIIDTEMEGKKINSKW